MTDGLDPTYDLSRAVGRLEAGVDRLIADLESHTKQDSDNFKALSEQLTAVAAKVDPKTFSKVAVDRAKKWGAVVAAVIVGAFEVARQLGLL